MRRRLINVLVSMTAVTAIVAALLTVVAIAGYQNRFDATPSDHLIDIYMLRNDDGSSLQCHRDNYSSIVLAELDGGIFEIEPVADLTEIERCIEAYKSERLPFDPRDFIGRYEAGYVIWEGVDHKDINHWSSTGRWGLPVEECAPYYEFKEKSHPWLVDVLGLVDTIEVAFEWTGSDAEWQTCLAAREKRISELDLSEFKAAIAENLRN